MRTLQPTLRTPGQAVDTLTLPFELRQKSRLRARLDSGEEIALFVPRGRVLRGGDHLLDDRGAVVEVRSAAELVSRVPCADPRMLARAAYHLGNRHIAVEVGAGWLQYLHDHVLDDMMRGLGLEVLSVTAPFEPETGAYAHGHSASHSHAQDGARAQPQAHDEAELHAHGVHSHEHHARSRDARDLQAPSVHHHHSHEQHARSRDERDLQAPSVHHHHSHEQHAHNPDARDLQAPSVHHHHSHEHHLSHTHAQEAAPGDHQRRPAPRPRQT